MHFRRKTYSIEAFDKCWYIETNRLDIGIDNAWTHYKETGQRAKLKSRYIINKTLIEVGREVLNKKELAKLREQLEKEGTGKIYFYPDREKSQHLINDPYYEFCLSYKDILTDQNIYSAIAKLKRSLEDSQGKIVGANKVAMLTIIGILTSEYLEIEEREDSGKNTWKNKDNELEHEEIQAMRRCFSESHYLRLYEDIRISGVDPLEHFIAIGRKEGRSGSEIFDPIYYLSKYKDVQLHASDPFVHYITVGWKEGRSPSKSYQNDWLRDVFPEAQHDPNGFCGYLNKGLSGEIKLWKVHNKYNNQCNISFRKKPEKAEWKKNDRTGVKLYAFYLTQYHPIEENDYAWGKGFTEWRNVTKAFPAYLGHYQPKLPYDSTLYDLRIKENIKEQINLATQHGIHGFCFYYYWFSGKRALEKPFNTFLENKEELDIPFCILWANENWTKKWDGRDKDIILGQDYTEEDSLNFIKDIEHVLLDKRYTRVNGKPMLIVYRPDDIPNCKDWVSRWRQYWKEKGYGELHLVCVQFLENTNPFDFGFDSMMQFPPNGFPNHGSKEKIARYEKGFEGNLYSYDEMQWRSISKKYDNEIYRTSVPSWDNEARRPGKGDIFVGSSPKGFRAWLTANIATASNDNSANICFINAWNEWAESACLEPDNRYGYAHLEAVLDARYIADMQEEMKGWEKSKDNALVIHAYYMDIFKKLQERIKLYAEKCDIYITIQEEGCHEKIEEIRSTFPRARFFITPNIGRDVQPFLSLVKMWNFMKIVYGHVGKLHTKKSPHRDDGDEWLNGMIEELLPNKAGNFLSYLEKSQAGILIPEGQAITLEDFMGGNGSKLLKILEKHRINVKNLKQEYFSSGTMFWIKGDILESLARNQEIYEFEEERGQLDGTLAHAWERAFCILAKAKGLNCKHTSGKEIKVTHAADYQFANLEGRIDIGRHKLKIKSFKTSAAEKPMRKIALLATYVSSRKDIKNIRNHCKYLQQKGLFVVCINPNFDYGSESDDNKILTRLHCDAYIERENIGYDFGSWAEAYLALQEKGFICSETTEEVILMNDSCLYLRGKDDIMDKARAIKAEVVGLTDSNQFIHHLQSNFLAFKTKAKHHRIVESFLINYHKRKINNKNEVIKFGELGLANALKDNGISIEAIYKEKSLVDRFTQKYRDQQDSSWEYHVLDLLMSGHSLNPHHYMHEILYDEMNCPLVKKEFLKSNPGKYPDIAKYKHLQKLIGK